MEQVQASGRIVGDGTASAQPGTDDWIPPGGYEHADAWAAANRAALEEYDRRLQAHGTAAEQLQTWLREPNGA